MEKGPGLQAEILLDSQILRTFPENTNSRKSNEICFTVFIPWGFGDTLLVPIIYINKHLDKLPEFPPPLLDVPSWRAASSVRLAAAHPIWAQICERLYSEKKNIQGKVPEVENVAKCREFEGIRWNELCPFHKIAGFQVTLT